MDIEVDFSVLRFLRLVSHESKQVRFAAEEARPVDEQQEGRRQGRLTVQEP